MAEVNHPIMSSGLFPPSVASGLVAISAATGSSASKIKIPPSQTHITCIKAKSRICSDTFGGGVTVCTIGLYNNAFTIKRSGSFSNFPLQAGWLISQSQELRSSSSLVDTLCLKERKVHEESMECWNPIWVAIASQKEFATLTANQLDNKSRLKTCFSPQFMLAN